MNWQRTSHYFRKESTGVSCVSQAGSQAEATWDRCRANGKQRECVNSSKITLPLIWYSSSQVDTPIASLKLKRRVVKKATPTIAATIFYKKNSKTLQPILMLCANNLWKTTETWYKMTNWPPNFTFPTKHNQKNEIPPTSPSQQNTIRRMKFLKTSTFTSPITEYSP